MYTTDEVLTEAPSGEEIQLKSFGNLCVLTYQSPVFNTVAEDWTGIFPITLPATVDHLFDRIMQI